MINNKLMGRYLASDEDNVIENPPLDISGGYKAPTPKATEPIVVNDSVTEKNTLLKQLMNEYPEQKKIGWADLIIPALSTAVGHATGYTQEGASAGMTGLKAQNEMIKDDNEYDQGKYKYKVALASALAKQPDPKTSYLKTVDESGKPSWTAVQPTKGGVTEIPILNKRGEDKKPSSAKREALYIDRAPKGANLGKYKVGESVSLSPEDQANLEAQGVVFKKAYTPGKAVDIQTGNVKTFENVPGKSIVPGARGSVFTPPNYPSGQDMTKSQLEELNKGTANYTNKTEPDRDALNKMGGIADSIKLYRSQGNILAGKQAMQQYMTALEKGPIGPSDREAVAQAYGGFDKMKRYFEEKIEGDPQTAMKELEQASSTLKKNIESRIAAEQAVNVNMLEQKGVNRNYVESVFGVDPVVRVINPDGIPGTIKKSKLQEKLKQGYKLE